MKMVREWQLSLFGRGRSNFVILFTALSCGLNISKKCTCNNLQRGKDVRKATRKKIDKKALKKYPVDLKQYSNNVSSA